MLGKDLEMAGDKLSKRVVDRLEARAKDYIVFDGELPGFGVRVMPNGKRFYLIQYRRHGRTRRMALGQHGVVTAEIARREANRMLGAVRGAGMTRRRCAIWNAKRRRFRSWARGS